MKQSDIKKFIQEKTLNNIFNSENTKRAYRNKLESWYNFSQGKDNLGTAKSYLDLLTQKHNSKTVKGCLYVLKSFYDWLSIESGNPFSILVKSYRVNKKESHMKDMERDQRVYSDDEVKSLLDKANRIANHQDPASIEFYLAYRNWFIILLMSEYGMRISGLMGCDLGHLNLKKRMLTIYDSKNQEPYPIPIKKTLVEFKQYLVIRKTIMSGQISATGEKALFLSNSGLRLSDTSARRAINAIAESADLYDPGRSTHQLRHYRATKYYKDGMPVDLISQIMGVSVPVLKKTYFHLTDDDTIMQYEKWLDVKNQKQKIFHCPICGYSEDEEKQIHKQKPRLEVLK